MSVQKMDSRSQYSNKPDSISHEWNQSLSGLSSLGQPVVREDTGGCSDAGQKE